VSYINILPFNPQMKYKGFLQSPAWYLHDFRILIALYGFIFELAMRNICKIINKQRPHKI
jgi:hypothetical protein